MYKCKWNLNKGSYIIKIKTIVIPLLPNFLSPIMNRSCQTLFLLFMYFIATARLSHGLDSVERESSVGAFLLRLRLLTSLSISHYALPAWFCHFTLILHLTCLENWTRSYRQCRPVPPVAAKGGPYNHDRVPKITWIWGPGMPIFTGCVNFYDTGPCPGNPIGKYEFKSSLIEMNALHFNN